MLSWTLALRYLISAKSHSAINAITIVASVGIAVITAAMICTLSVYNGFEALVDDLCSEFDADLTLVPRQGKTFSDSDSLRHIIVANGGVEALSATLTEDVLATHDNQQIPARLKGVDLNYGVVTHLDSIILRDTTSSRIILGTYDEYLPSQANVIAGIGIAYQLRTAPGFATPVEVWCPVREGHISLLRGEEAFREGRLFCEAVFEVRQAIYDDQVLIAPLPFARRLLGDSLLTSAYELKLAPGARPRTVAQQLGALLPEFRVMDRRALHADAFRIMQIEKWITFLLIIFILLIASFNIIGAISMLQIDKQQETCTLRDLGADNGFIRMVFLQVGVLISGTGALAGIVIGIGLCLLQEHFSLITLGDGGSYVVDAYPVRLVWTDVLWTLLGVALVGCMATSAVVLKIKK
jgi:ABC-type lipoprotein release transport system permease subunit